VNRARSESWFVLLFLLLASFLGPLDGSIVNIILPKLTEQFSVHLQEVKWVVLIYLLVTTSLLLIAGRLADRIGYRTVLVIGLVIFIASSFALAFSPSIGFMVLMRGVQAIGATLMFATTSALVARVFVRHRGLALGMVGTSVSIALTAGPPLGGVLTDYFTWRSVFLVNVPLGIIAIAGILATVKVTHEPATPVPMPAASTVNFAVAVGSLVLWLHWLSDPPGEALAGVVRLLPWSFIVFGGLFTVCELRGCRSLVEYSLFRVRDFSISALAGVMQFINTNIVLFLLPFLLISYLGYEARVAGLLMAAQPICNIVVAPSAGHLSDRIGYRFLTTAGLVLTSVGLFLLATVGKASSFWHVLGILSVLGIGAGIFGSPNTSSLLGATPKDKLGTGSAVMAFARNLGMLLGISGAALLLAWREGIHQTALGLAPTSESVLYGSQTFILAFHDIAILAGLMALGTAIISSFTRK